MQRCFLKRSRRNQSLTELDESSLIQFSMDGPSVNRNVLEKLDDYLTNKNYLELCILEAVTSIYCLELSKLSFKVLGGILIKS